MKKRTAVWLGIIGALSAAALILSGFLFFSRPADPSLLKGTRILLAGDSRSSTDYTFYRELLEKKTGAEVIVAGASGRTAAYNASEEYLSRVTGDEHDFSLWLVGGNDDGSPGTIGTFSSDSSLAHQGEPLVEETDTSREYEGDTFIQAIDHIMRRYKALCYDSSRNASGRAVRMIFCTDLPQQRDSTDSPWSLRENWERKRLAILECCEKNGIPCLDLYALCGFDMSFEPMYHEPTDTESDRGIYYMDGLHPNRRGMDLITNLEAEILERYRIGRED